MSCYVYLNSILNGKRINWKKEGIIRLIAGSEIQFGSIAITGISGLILGPVVAAQLNKRILVVRKNIETTNSDKIVEGRSVKNDKYIIIDDFIQSGTTINKITKEINIFNPTAKCMGIFLYNESDVRTSFNDIKIFFL